MPREAPVTIATLFMPSLMLTSFVATALCRSFAQRNRNSGAVLARGGTALSGLVGTAMGPPITRQNAIAILEHGEHAAIPLVVGKGQPRENTTGCSFPH